MIIHQSRTFMTGLLFYKNKKTAKQHRLFCELYSLYFYSFYFTRTILSLYIVIDPDKNHLPLIPRQKRRIVPLFDLFKSTFTCFVPFKLNNHCRKCGLTLGDRHDVRYPLTCRQFFDFKIIVITDNVCRIVYKVSFLANRFSVSNYIQISMQIWKPLSQWREAYIS